MSFVSNLAHSLVIEWKMSTILTKNKMNGIKKIDSFTKILPHTKMAGRDKNDRTNSRTICQQNRIAFSPLVVSAADTLASLPFHFPRVLVWLPPSPRPRPAKRPPPPRPPLPPQPPPVLENSALALSIRCWSIGLGHLGMPWSGSSQLKQASTRCFCGIFHSFDTFKEFIKSLASLHSLLMSIRQVESFQLVK